MKVKLQKWCQNGSKAIIYGVMSIYKKIGFRIVFLIEKKSKKVEQKMRCDPLKVKKCPYLRKL